MPDGQALRDDALALPETAPPLVRFEGVSKSFGPRQGSAAVTALDGIDLAVAKGSILGIIGRSGAGKSTLIRLVNGLEQPSGGRVFVDGVEIAGLRAAALRRAQRAIGMIFQHFNLLSSRTAFGNVALPLEIAGRPKAEIAARVGQLLELVGLADKRNRYPAELSGGQKQRVGIARALATAPKLLLSDEATSALDPETTRSILALLSRVNAELGVTILLITHEVQVIKDICHRVAVLDGGHIVEEGPIYDLFTRPRHPTTMSFVEAAIGVTLPAEVASRIRPLPQPGGTALLRLTFTGSGAAQPAVSRLSRALAVDVNVLAGQIHSIAGRPFGVLVIGVPEAAAADGRGLALLADLGVAVEVIGHVA